MNAYQPLNCDLHDYLEIACMHGYDLQVELIDGSTYVAKALTTRTATSKEEFLVCWGIMMVCKRLKFGSTICWRSRLSMPMRVLVESRWRGVTASLGRKLNHHE